MKTKQKVKIKKVKTDKYYKRIFCLIVTLISLLTFFIATWFCGDTSTINYINAYDFSIEPTKIEITKYPTENYVEINNKTGRPLKILQLSDLHIGCGYLSLSLDKKLVNEVFKCVSIVNPDLIIVTGDAISPIYITSGTRNSYLQIDAFINLMEKLNRPYTYTFGNHDERGLASKKYFSNKLELAPNSFYLSGDKNLSGEGNYYAKVLNDGILVSSLMFLDNGTGNFIERYKGIDNNQLVWYEKSINSLKQEKSTIKNLLFMHIPLPEYKNAYTRWSNGDENYVKILGSKNEKFSPTKQNGLYEKIKNLDVTKWLFCGHNHTNNFSILELSTGITFSYGMSMDYSAYPLLKFKNEYRGGKTIEINSLGEVSIKLAPQKLNYTECVM